MRVISGKYKGKKLEGFTVEGTRPTMDRVKESLFGMIQSRLRDAIVLDLFAGSGALGIEALSEGAKEAYFVESGNRIFSILKNNTKEIANCHLFLSDYQVALQQFQREQQKFDIVFLDPPYSLHLITPVLQKITPLLKNHSLLVCEWETEKIEVDAHYRLWKEKKYGEKHISIYEYLV